MEFQKRTVKLMIENLNDYFKTNHYGHKSIILKSSLNGMKVFTKSSLERNRQLCMDVHDRLFEEIFDEMEEYKLQDEQNNMEILAEQHYWQQWAQHEEDD
jgi:hypothetical protein